MVIIVNLDLQYLNQNQRLRGSARMLLSWRNKVAYWRLNLIQPPLIDLDDRLFINSTNVIQYIPNLINCT
jgi:hypothetical protein